MERKKFLKNKKKLIYYVIIMVMIISYTLSIIVTLNTINYAFEGKWLIDYAFNTEGWIIFANIMWVINLCWVFENNL